MDLYMYYTVNMAVVNYFGTEIPKIEEIDGHKQIELAELHEKDLTESEDHFTVTDLYYLKLSDSNCKRSTGRVT